MTPTPAAADRLMPKLTGRAVPALVVRIASTANLLPAGNSSGALVVLFDAVNIVPILRVNGVPKATLPSGIVTRTADGVNVKFNVSVPVIVPRINVKPTVVGVTDVDVNVTPATSAMDILATGFCAVRIALPFGGKTKSTRSILGTNAAAVKTTGTPAGKVEFILLILIIGTAISERPNGINKLPFWRVSAPAMAALIAVMPVAPKLIKSTLLGPGKPGGPGGPWHGVTQTGGHGL